MTGAGGDPLSVQVVTAYGPLTLRAVARDRLHARGDELTINGVRYRLNQSMYLHPDGSRTGNLETSGWQHFEVGGWSGPFYMRRVESRPGRIGDDYPSDSAREKMTAALREAAATVPPELLELADAADVEQDIAAREASIAAAEEYIGRLRHEIALLRAGGREQYRPREHSSTKHRVIVTPNGEAHSTHAAEFRVN